MRRLWAGAELAAVESDLQQVSRSSPMRDVLLTRKAALLANEFRVHEAVTTLESLRGRQDESSIATLKSTIASLADEMSQHVSPACERVRSTPDLPEGVRVLDKGDGEWGLAADRAFEADEAVFVETPLAVVAESDDACAVCLRPMRARRALSADGEWLEDVSPEQVENIMAECNLPRLELIPGDNCCSDDCRSIRDANGINNTSVVEEETSSRLLAQLPVFRRQQLLACLRGSEESAYQGEPASLSSADRPIWRTVRKNCIEAETQPMAVVVEKGGVTPIIDEEQPSCQGSALFLVASLINHHCTAANVAPAFLDSLKATPFVATVPIAAGEELFFDYAATVTDKRDKRIRNFIAHRFVCKC
jgi:hypothetical protein